MDIIEDMLTKGSNRMQTEPAGKTRFFLISATTIGFIYSYTGRSLLPPLLPSIVQEFGLTQTRASFLLSIPLLVYAAMQLAVDKLSLRIGKVRTLLLSTLMYGVSMLIVGVRAEYWWLLLVQLLGSIATGPYFVTGLAVVEESSRLSKYGPGDSVWTGLYVAAGGIGAIIAPAIAGLVLRMNKWRMAYTLLGFVGILVGVVLFFLITWGNSILEDPIEKPSEIPSRQIGSSSYLRSPSYLVALIVFLLNSVRTYGMNAHFCTYLVEAKSIDRVSAADVYAIMQISGLFGQAMGGVAVGWVGAAKVVMGLLACNAALVCAVMRAAPHGLGLATYVMLGFFSAACFPVMLKMLMDLVPSEVRTAATGTANGLSYLAAAIGPAFTGSIIDSFGFSTGFLFLAFVSMLGFMLLFAGTRLIPELMSLGLRTSRLCKHK